ncbi:MAG: dioxygenase [Actinomycetota bacterium]
MAQITIENITDVFEKSIEADMDPRLRELLTGLVRHLHDFARETRLTHDEWFAAMMFLTRAGAMTDDKRNEFVLIADVLGIESLVDAITHDAQGDETESAVLGPFYREGAPVKGFDDTISMRGALDGETARIRGRVVDRNGEPIAGATLDVWETARNGMYEQQDPDQPDMNLRGLFETAADGTYSIRCVRPVSYPIPFDGPAGEVLAAMGRHPNRPGHIHMIVRKDGYQSLVSQLYDRSDPYLSSDAVYAVKGSLVVDFEAGGDGVEYTVTHNVVLKSST